MIPIDFEGSNIIMEKPKEMTDEQCMPLHAMKSVTTDGFPFFIECWQPNKEDIEAIINGRPIYIQILSNSLPPISVWTLNENHEVNI